VSDLSQISAALKAMESKQVRILTGTVQGYSNNPATVPVLLDNDSGGSSEGIVVSIPSVCGTLPGGARVSILTVPPAGMIVIGTAGIEGGLTPPYSVAARSRIPTWSFPRSYVADDIWTVPSNPLFLGAEIVLQAGGGGSGGTASGTAQSSSSGGGQGGAYYEGLVLAASLPKPGTGVFLYVGAGGAGAAAGNNPGGDGGASSFIAEGLLAAAATAGDTSVEVDYAFNTNNTLTLSPGLPAEEIVTVTLSTLTATGPDVYTLSLAAPLANSHLLAALVYGARCEVDGGEGGQGGGVSATAPNTTQNGGDAVQGFSNDGGVVFMDFARGDDGGTGSRSGGGGSGVILPGFGGGSRMSGITRFGGRSAGQIAPAAGYPFGGGASGRGVDLAGAFGDGTGSAGASGLVAIREIYRT
jgi:hypothetical protein